MRCLLVAGFLSALANLATAQSTLPAPAAGQVIPIEESNFRITLPGPQWTCEIDPIRSTRALGPYQSVRIVGPEQVIVIKTHFTARRMTDDLFDSIITGMKERVSKDGGTVDPHVVTSRDWMAPDFDIWCVALPVDLPDDHGRIYLHTRAFTSDGHLYLLSGQWTGSDPSPEFLQLADSFQHLRAPAELPPPVVNRGSTGSTTRDAGNSPLSRVWFYALVMLLGAGVARLIGLHYVWAISAILILVAVSALVSVMAAYGADGTRVGDEISAALLPLLVAGYLARRQFVAARKDVSFAPLKALVN